MYLISIYFEEETTKQIQTYRDLIAEKTGNRFMIDGVKIHNYYKPFQWMPHTTIGKTLSKEEMKTAFAIMQEQFALFEGTVTKIGLAKTNPHRDLLCVECGGTTLTELS